MGDMGDRRREAARNVRRISTAALVGLATFGASITAGAISGGSSAPNDKNVVFVGMPNANCTGVLVTPTRVIMAAHCVRGASNFLNALLNKASVQPYPPGAAIRLTNAASVGIGLEMAFQPDDIGRHTPNPGIGFVVEARETDSPMNFLNPSIAEEDIAVIPLDWRVKMSDVMPAQLPFEADGTIHGCSFDFSGRFLGYGNEKIGGVWAQGERTRDQATAHIFKSSASVFGDTYRAAFGIEDWITELPVLDVLKDTLLGELLGLDDVHLLMPGDSGGPMFQGAKLCGINSGIYLSPVNVTFECDFTEFPPCWYHVGITVDDIFARVDSQDAVSWLRPRLTDSEGHFHGTCGPDSPPGYEDLDSDSDGIPDGCDPCPYFPDNNYLLTGEVTNPQGMDNDGVPDICDNCPTRHNPWVALSTPSGPKLVQADSDQDGVGDACDSCAHSDVRGVKDMHCCSTDADCIGTAQAQGSPLPLQAIDNTCTPIAPFSVVNNFQVPGPCVGFAGRCPLGVDLDRDYTSDACDNCPGITNNNQQDADNDGVGNVCDNCPGTGFFPDGVDHSADKNDIFDMECENDGDCASLDAQSRCVPGRIAPGSDGKLMLQPSHCSWFQDFDGDGLGDACDNCMAVPNVAGWQVDEINGQANCNLASEIANDSTAYPFIGDECDPNPCNRPFQGGVSVPDQTKVKGDLWVTFRYDPHILPNSSLAEYPAKQGVFNNQYVATPAPKATVGARYCPCAKALEHDALACQLQCPLDEPNHYDSSTSWTHARIVATPLLANGQPSDGLLPQTPADNFFPLNAELVGLPLAAPPNVTLQTSDNLPSYLGAHTSVSWDVTKNGAAEVGIMPDSPAVGFGLVGVLWTAVRHAPMVFPTSVDKFLPYSNRYNPSFFGGLHFEESFLNAKASCGEICDFGVCKVCMIAGDMKDMVISPAKQKVFVKFSGGQTEVTSSFSQAALSAIFDTGSRWLVVAERGSRLTRQSIGFATLSQDGTTVKSVLAMRSGVLSPLTRTGDAIDIAAAQVDAIAKPAPSPAARSDFGAVLSDTEQSLFVFGGKLATGELASDLWLFDVGTSKWTAVPFSGPAPRKVLAATYTPEKRSLWLVDEADAKITSARLLRYDVGARQFQVLGTWPRTPAIDRVELSGAHGGNLLLTGSSSLTQHVAGVVVRPGDGNVKVIGAFQRKGTLALEPTLGPSVLTLPLADSSPTGIEHLVVPASEVLFKPKEKGKGPQLPVVTIGHCL